MNEINNKNCIRVNSKQAGANNSSLLSPATRRSRKRQSPFACNSLRICLERYCHIAERHYEITGDEDDYLACKLSRMLMDHWGRLDGREDGQALTTAQKAFCAKFKSRLLIWE